MEEELKYPEWPKDDFVTKQQLLDHLDMLNIYFIKQHEQETKEYNRKLEEFKKNFASIIRASTVIHDSLDILISIHGHEGSTVIEFD